MKKYKSWKLSFLPYFNFFNQIMRIDGNFLFFMTWNFHALFFTLIGKKKSPYKIFRTHIRSTLLRQAGVVDTVSSF